MVQVSKSSTPLPHVPHQNMLVHRPLAPLRQQSKQRQDPPRETVWISKSNGNGKQKPPKAGLLAEKKRSRSRKPKTRTGCITCKIRRVKCDEAQPHCARCIKFGTVCDGYPRPKPPPAAPHKRATLSRIAPKGRPEIDAAPKIPRFSNDEESHFFTLYVRNTASEITGPFTTSLWARLVPQASEAEPYIRQIVAGIGAMSAVIKAPVASALDPHRKRTYEYALRQYDRALHGMQGAIAGGRHNIRYALIACLLVFCFESMLGDPTSAARNARSGLGLLAEYMASRGGSSSPPGQSCGLETDILQAFAALDLHVLFFLDTRSESQHAGLVEQLLGCVRDGMPRRFGDLEGSRDFWILLQRRNYHFNVLAAEAVARWRRGLAEGDAGDLAPLRNALEQSRAQMQQYREDVRRWSRASAAVFARVMRAGTWQEKIVMNLLKIHAHLNHVQLAATFMASEMEYDAFLADYAAIVDLAEEIYPYLASSPDPSEGGLFRFDLGIVYPLTAVGFRCRSNPTRTRAIALLHQPYKEGFWDSQTTGFMTSWIQKIEEESSPAGAPTDFIPEARRAVMTVCDVDLKARRVRLGAVRAAADGDADAEGAWRRTPEGSMYREETLPWRFGVGARDDVVGFGGDRYLSCFRGGETTPWRHEGSTWRE